MENILSELLAFSCIGAVVVAVGVLWGIVSRMFGTDDPTGDIHDDKKEQHEVSKDD